LKAVTRWNVAVFEYGIREIRDPSSAKNAENPIQWQSGSHGKTSRGKCTWEPIVSLAEDMADYGPADVPIWAPTHLLLAILAKYLAKYGPTDVPTWPQPACCSHVKSALGGTSTQLPGPGFGVNLGVAFGVPSPGRGLCAS
jgi:hypothetical protein